jgi:hypothetical protein
MTEPLNPSAAGVASALKSLRARAGLTKERLSASELAHDSLAGLPVVRQLIDAGEEPESAIMHAVQEAAKTLEPTLAIVADVSLALGREGSPDRIPDADLYAQDLGQRRDALLKNWDLLHELRNVRPGKVPAQGALRLEIEVAALAALAVALTDPVGSSAAPKAVGVVVGTDRHEPSPSKYVRPISLAEIQASGPPTLLATFKNIAKALRGSLIKEDGMALGWPHNLRQLSTIPTPAATAYGIKAMLLLEEYLAPDLTTVADNLSKLALPGGGYRTRDQHAPSPEATAAVVDALHRIDGTAGVDVHLAKMGSALGVFEKRRPFILTMMLETSVQLVPDGKLTESLIKALLSARQLYGDLLLWPEKAGPHLVDPAPSTAHTARAVRALANFQAVHPSDQVKEALDQAVVWLLEQGDLSNASEVIDRPLDESADNLEKVYVRHFTAAWVVKALVSAGIPATHSTVRNAVTQIWNSYSGDEAGLWRWDNGDLPIWMTFDAVDALRLANLAIPAYSREVTTSHPGASIR